ncbi:hypothetical protein L210DRAFT_3756721 [Boletus edulis BED1]|uniref:Uncharacterized protein n=1 Tax=Boletus edulis BED1 TaxID=1328754 RepID=A0AAD4C4J2_BOLED|nr:hypothetical protein L210DRAFT_3756721 [Boletus edulis BED1]
MNVSDLLQDSPSQHRRRPAPLQHESPPPTQSATTSLPSASVSPQSQHQLQHTHSHQHPSQPPPASQAPYPPQPNPYYPPHPFSRQDPSPIHRITPRPQIQPSPTDPTPAMASLQHPSPSAPPPHVHSHTPWGPAASRQGSSPLAVSNLGAGASLHARTSHHHQPPTQIKPAMPGSDRSPVQRAHASGSSTPSNIAAHSPPSKQLLTTAAGVLILDEQMARPAQAQAQAHGSSSAHPNTSSGASFKSGRDREKEWDQRDRERQQEDMDFIRHVARERVVGGPFDRERERERALPSPRDRSLASPHERSLASPHDRPIPSAHDRPLAPALDRPIPSPHERDRPPHHMHRMSPLARPPAQAPPPLRTPAQVQQSSPGPSHRMAVGPPPHDRILPPNERDRMPPLPHERPLHDRDRIHPLPPHAHPHRQGPPLLPGQGQFQTHLPEWDPARERERDMAVGRERERDMIRERDMPMSAGGPPRDLVREKDVELTRDPEYGFHPDHDRAAYLRERDRQRMRDASRDQGVLLPQRERDVVPPGQRDIAMQRERERMMDRDREFMSRDTEGIPMLQREREMRERELHIQRERERVAQLHREGETGPGMPPRGHDRERDRDRERRTHSRMPSPHGMNIGGAGVPPLANSTTGPGAPGPHHLPPPPHDHPRERDLQFMNERDRQLAWEREREREREMDRRQHRERISMPDRERMGILPERDERIALADRERAMAERDRAMFERDRMALPERDRAFVERDRFERERMAERDRVFLERERMVVNDRDRVMHDRERALPPERVVLERERVILERPGDRERVSMRPHPFDVAERERAEAFEREREHERLEAMERDRERGLQAASASGAGRDREGDKDRKAVDVSMGERERDERPPAGPATDRELVEKRERERLELVERERGSVMDREREPMNTANREGEPTEAERERLEARERFEMLQRELGELYERDRLGGLDVMDRERLTRLERESFELLERERLEMLERERLEMLERMPSAEELAKARKERERKPFVSLGTYVWPRTPFPYYFPEWIPTPIVEEDKPIEAKTIEAGSSSSSLAPISTPQPTSAATQIPTELRLTVLVPPSFLPPARPQKFRLWGGGLPPPPPFPYTPSIYSFSRRRVYTDDSDVIQCAVHAGLLTWSGIARAKKEGRTIQVVLALVPTLASASGVAKSGQSESRVGANGHVNGTASVPRTRTNTPLPPPPASSVPSTSSSNNDPQPPGYAGGVWASRFIGGWGESFYGKESAGRGDNAGRMTSFEEAEDDGRGCVSCGWGWGHDGSAFEVIGVDVVEQNAHIAPGLGIRNRAQRLAEYAQRRADILGLPSPPSPPFLDVTNTPKRRKLNVDFTEMRKAGLSEMTTIAEEAKKMQAMTISFGVPDRGKSKTGVGFKYHAQVMQSVLFPHLHQGSIVSPPPKRRKIAVTRETQADGDVEMDSADELRRGVVLESSKETYLITSSVHEGKERYTLSVLCANASQSCSSMPSTLLADAASKTQDKPTSSLPEPSEERKTASTDDQPPNGNTTDPPESSTPRDATSKEKGTSASKPPSTCLLGTSSKPTVRFLRLDLSEDDFCFEKDIIVIKGSLHPVDDEKMVVDSDGGDAIKIRVLRWRWYVEP